jgi:hypothetical protein
MEGPPLPVTLTPVTCNATFERTEPQKMMTELPWSKFIPHCEHFTTTLYLPTNFRSASWRRGFIALLSSRPQRPAASRAVWVGEESEARFTRQN